MATDINSVDTARSIYDQFSRDSAALWEALEATEPTLKNRIVIAFGLLGQQHCRSAALLAEVGCLSSARALVRSAAEACGRAMLVAYKKDEEWSEKAFFALENMQKMANSGNDDGIYDEEKIVYLPTLAKLVNQLRDIPDQKSFQIFEDIINKIIPMLNSFTHGGIGSLGRMINDNSIEEPYDPDENSRMIVAMASLDCCIVVIILRIFGCESNSYVANHILKKAMIDNGFSVE